MDILVARPETKQNSLHAWRYGDWAGEWNKDKGPADQEKGIGLGVYNEGNGFAYFYVDGNGVTHFELDREKLKSLGIKLEYTEEKTKAS